MQKLFQFFLDNIKEIFNVKLNIKSSVFKFLDPFIYHLSWLNTSQYLQNSNISCESYKIFTPSSDAQSLFDKVVVSQALVNRQTNWSNVDWVLDVSWQSQERNIVVLVWSLWVVVFMWNLQFDRNIDWCVVADFFINERVIAIHISWGVPFAETNAG